MMVKGLVVLSVPSMSSCSAVAVVGERGGYRNCIHNTLNCICFKHHKGIALSINLH